jgi:CheY-like chemotaxis protein
MIEVNMRQAQPSTLFLHANKREEHPVVLVVDDHPTIREMLSWMLSLQGYRPVCAANGQEALEWIKNSRGSEQYPAAILLDLLMPVMNGATFLTCLHAQWDAPLPIPPVILLTVDKSNHDNLACRSVLLKPFHIGDLYESLKQAIKIPHA